MLTTLSPTTSFPEKIVRHPLFGRQQTENSTIAKDSDSFKTPKATSQTLLHPLDTLEGKNPKLTYEITGTRHDPMLGDIHEATFSNGMNFIGIARPSVPLISIGEMYHAGSNAEDNWSNGALHFLEHLIFKG